MAKAQKKKPVYKPIQTRFGRARTTNLGKEREIISVSTGEHPLDVDVFHIEDMYLDPKQNYNSSNPDVVIRDYVVQGCKIVCH